MTESQYTILKQFTRTFIDLSLSQGKELKLEDIDSYINQAVMLSKLDCDEAAKTRLFIDMEYEYKIVHNKGQAIFNDYGEKREWYSNLKIQDNFFWSRYKDYLINHSSISRISINLLDDITLPDIMNCLGNPNDALDKPRLRRGLIIGDVQSGKTATYTGLICKAADAGYKVVILLTGITENLRRQTQERIDEGIVGITLKKEGKIEKYPRVGVGLDNKQIKATSVTSTLNDFVGNCNKITMSLASNSLVLFVIKKNVSVLQRLFNWLREQNIDPVKGYVNVPMLLIDDEADNASVNTRKDETDPTRTNKLIRQICNLFMNSTYVGFTATPFANVFIDPDSVDAMQHADLFPEHFIYALEAPSNYVGADKIFYPEGTFYHNLRYITDITEPDYASEEYKDLVQNNLEVLNSGTFYYKHKKEWDGILPDSLRESILCFCLANVVRDLRGQSKEPRSMLVNMSRFIHVQKVITGHVAEWFEAVFNDIRVNFNEDASKNHHLPLYGELRSLWEKHFSQVNDVTFARVSQKATLLAALEKIEVKMVNGSKQSASLNYKENPSLRVIAIGGLALSRGLTLEGLMVSYFYRNTATFDVLMQMGRWFGYRRGYEDLFQIWTSHTSALWYAEVAKASAELKNDIREMFDQQLTPKDFGIKVRDNCDELQITASNKMRTAVSKDMMYSFYGNIYDTPYITSKIEHNKINMQRVQELASELFAQGYSLRFTDYKKVNKDVNDTSDGSSRYFADVPKEVVVEFLRGIKYSMANPRFDAKNIINFLEDEDTEGVDLWDVVFESGKSTTHYNVKGLRQIKCMERSICSTTRNIIQISTRRRVMTGSMEGRFALSKEDIESAEDAQRNQWEKDGENSLGRDIPVKAYFRFLPKRKPMLIIMFIKPKEADGEEEEMLHKYREALGDDCIVAFAVGCPGVKEEGKAVKYQVNKIFQQLNIEGEEPEEEDDDE
ncbi:endonuclease [Prevotella sp. P5-108]|uniref:Z1 domain-containing protein n=1 Tax=Prevotella sp. P5-108 TaxID=2024225 RepID=UPI000B9771FC|nr:Z1 domain-containing protein [Prevotella sp. P5-108]OYP66430.1 endonuclease [Prevotella sp. P5-108]